MPAGRLAGRPAGLVWTVILGVAVAGFVAAFVWQTWTAHARAGTLAFDLGIFDQGTWLLSRFANPFVTVRGLPLFGDHASYILILVAPLYRVWADVRLLLLLQVLALAAPALAVYRLAGRRLGSPAAGLALAVAYLAYPGMQWAAVWQFHPETLAAGFLAGAVVAADARRGQLLATCVVLALLCKEDVGLVVAGFGGVLWCTGDARWGRRVVATGLGWFLVATFVLIPLANGRSSPHLALNYGVEATGPASAFLALPKLVANAASFTLSGDGVIYLLLVLGPLALLPLVGWRWLLPVAGPIGLNLAATHPFQQSIRYQYLATSAMFLTLATAAGIATLAARRRWLLGILCGLVLLCAGGMDHQVGPALWSKAPLLNPLQPNATARQEAMALIEPGAAVSAQYHFVAHLAHRKEIYDFPNPFIPTNWGFPGDRPSDAAVSSVRYIVAEPLWLNLESDQPARELLERLSQDPGWAMIYDRDGVVVLRRAGDGRHPTSARP